MRNRLSIIGNEFTRLLCSFAIIIVAFAHTVPNANAALSNLAAYTLPDGSLPDFCFNSGTASGEKSAKTECEYCRIAGAALPHPSVNSIQFITFENFETILSKPRLPDTNSIALSVRSLRGPPKFK